MVEKGMLDLEVVEDWEFPVAMNFVPPHPNSCIEVLIHNVIIFGDRACKELIWVK